MAAASAGGRGLNAALVETRRMRIVSVHNFDLYSQNSSELEHWLEARVRHEHIIIAFTFDEASKELSKKAKASLYKLGSGKIQDLQFRSQWYMISQKGIEGFTALERLTFAKNDHWGEAIDERMCVPKRIPSVAITPDPYPRKNSAREKVCREVAQLQCTDFCATESQHEVYSPALLTNRSLIGNPVYSSPIVVVAGRHLASLVLTLQSLVHQPGVHAPSVLVVYAGQGHQQGQGHSRGHISSSDYATVINLFSFQAVAVNVSSGDAWDYIEKGIETAKERFPNKNYVIVIEQGVVLSPDFLHYMAQMVTVLEQDTTVLAISAWNPNGFVNVSSNPYRAYRGTGRPQYAFMVPIQAFNSNRLTHNYPKQFHRESNNNSTTVADEIVYPEVSRALVRPLDIILSGTEQSHHHLDIPRSTNIDPAVWIENPNDLILDHYLQHINAMLNQSRELVISNEEIASCAENSHFSNVLANDAGNRSTIAIFYKESSSEDYIVLRALANGCFGLKLGSEKPPPGLFRGMLRFSFNNRHVMLIELGSYFYKQKQSIVEKKFI